MAAVPGVRLSSSSPCRGAVAAFFPVVLQWEGEAGEQENDDPWQCWCVYISLPLFQKSFPSLLSVHSSLIQLFSFTLLILIQLSNVPAFVLFPPLQFQKSPLSSQKKSSSAAGVESSIYRLEGRGLLLRVGSRGAACWSARQGAWGFRLGHCSMF